MKFIKFKGMNCTYAEDQAEYLPLPAHKSEDGVVTSCSKLNLWERLKVLFTGRVYLSLYTFNEPLQPQLMSTKNPVREDEK